LETLLRRNGDAAARTVAWVSLLAVIAKCCVELVTGSAFFTGLHFGLLGTPIVACHAGGVVGAMLWTWLASRKSPALPTKQFFQTLRSVLRLHPCASSASFSSPAHRSSPR
jgi:hypothetical protein